MPARKLCAYALPDGAIQFSSNQEPLILIASGKESLVRENITRTARADDNGNLFVPEMQEAQRAGEDTGAYMALARYIQELGRFSNYEFKAAGA